MKRLVLVVSLVTIFMLVGATVALAAVDSFDVSDEELVDEFVRLLYEKDMEGLEAFLSPHFLLQRPDGAFHGKEDYLRNPVHIEEYIITDIVSRRVDNVRVIRYNLSAVESIDGVWIPTDPMPRLSTYIWTGERWQLLGHANFVAVPRN